MLRKLAFGFATALALGGASFAVTTANAAPVTAGALQAVQVPGDQIQEAQYYGRRRHYGPRRFYGPRYYGPRYYGPRYYASPPFYGPPPLFAPRPYYGPRYLY